MSEILEDIIPLCFLPTLSLGGLGSAGLLWEPFIAPLDVGPVGVLPLLLLNASGLNYFRIFLNISFSGKFTDHSRSISAPNLCENRLMAMNFKRKSSFLLFSPKVIICLPWWLAFSPVYRFHWGSEASSLASGVAT